MHGMERDLLRSTSSSIKAAGCAAAWPPFPLVLTLAAAGAMAGLWLCGCVCGGGKCEKGAKFR